MSPTPVINRLRETTASMHARLEDRLDILNRIADPAGRRTLMARFFGLYQGVEDSLAQALAPVSALDYEARRKAPVLRRDLELLGVPPAAADVAVPPRFDSLTHAMGFQYVLEGSTLGGQVIRRDAERRGLGLEGLGFFDVYGAETGARWRSFRLLLEEWCSTDAASAAAGAVGGFALVEAWLCGEGRR